MPYLGCVEIFRPDNRVIEARRMDTRTLKQISHWLELDPPRSPSLEGDDSEPEIDV